LHCFAVTDMHQENLIAVGDQPVPVDLETTLQAAEQSRADNEDAKDMQQTIILASAASADRDDYRYRWGRRR